MSNIENQKKRKRGEDDERDVKDKQNDLLAEKPFTGQIYKLQARESGLVYIGSTKRPLEERKWAHKTAYNSFKAGTYDHNLSSFRVIKEGRYFIKAIYKGVFETRREMLQKEQQYIEKYKHEKGDLCVNVMNSYTDKESKKRADREYAREYRQKDENKEKISEYRRNYFRREDVKKRRQRKITCCCGSSLSSGGKFKHRKRNKHREFINQNPKKRGWYKYLDDPNKKKYYY